MSQLPLPEGWIQEFDPKQKHPFWVDTRAKPPRAIWVHPYEDEQFLSEHPDVKARVEKLQGTPLEAPPPYEKRRHSISGGEPNGSFPSYNDAGPSGSTGAPPTDEQREARKRGVLARLKDKTIGTKEEREAHKKQKEEEREAHRKQKEAEREAYRKWKAEGRAREEEELREARRRNLEERAAYMQRHGGYPPYGGYGGCSGMYGPPMGDPYAYNSRRTGRSSGFGGLGLPLLGGLAGGLLLGDILDGGFGGGDFFFFFFFFFFWVERCCLRAVNHVNPLKHVDVRESRNKSPRGNTFKPGAFYALALLDVTGICVVPGGGFGLRKELESTVDMLIMHGVGTLKSICITSNMHHYSVSHTVTSVTTASCVT